MDILIYILKSAVVLALFYTVYYLILRKDTFFTTNRHFLLFGVIVSLLVPFIEFTRYSVIEIPEVGASLNPDLIQFSNSELGLSTQVLVEDWAIRILDRCIVYEFKIHRATYLLI